MKSPVQMIPVTSSNVSRVGYCKETKKLHVEFSSGGTYVYHDVSPTDHFELVNSKSIGKHMSVIKGKYRGDRL